MVFSMLFLLLLAVLLGESNGKVLKVESCPEFGATASCMFDPPNCFSNNPMNCEIGVVLLFPFTPSDSTLKVTLMAGNLPPNNYLALGFSMDDMMGRDFVVFGKNKEESPLGLAYTVGSYRKTATVYSHISALGSVESSVNRNSDGMFSAEFSLNLEKSLPEPEPDAAFGFRSLSEPDQLYVFLASGPIGDNGRLMYHNTNKHKSAEPIRFNLGQETSTGGSAIETEEPMWEKETTTLKTMWDEETTTQKVMREEEITTSKIMSDDAVEESAAPKSFLSNMLSVILKVFNGLFGGQQ